MHILTVKVLYIYIYRSISISIHIYIDIDIYLSHYLDKLTNHVNQLNERRCTSISKDIFSVAPGTEMRSPGTLVFCALKIA